MPLSNSAPVNNPTDFNQNSQASQVSREAFAVLDHYAIILQSGLGQATLTSIGFSKDIRIYQMDQIAEPTASICT